jgi:arylsulfatase A-like enzyme
MSTRRQFLKTAAAGALAAHSAAQSRRKPNVLFIFSDQHRACSMPGEPFNDADAPNLARLAREGLTARNCISNYPVCSPYRGILLSGRWPYQTGIIDNSHPLKESETSLGEVFRRNGYRTGYIGKWHLDARGAEGRAWRPPGSRHGFDEWHAWYNTNPHFDKSYTFDLKTRERLQPEGYNATLMTDTTLDFIERHGDEPWMLTVAWNPPHPPFLDAPPDLMKRYEPGGLKLRPNAVETVGRVAYGPTDWPVRDNLQGYNAHITAIDREMGRILDKLDETGQTENTIVVYTSDHGEMMGSQGRTGKRLPYDESCKVPFVVRYPGAVPAGARTDELLSAIDLYQTMCGLAGLDAPVHCQGEDLSSILQGAKRAGPEHTFLMHIEKDHASGGRNHPARIFRGIRTKRYTYAVGEIGRWCLYDNQNDPYQQSNLVSRERHRGLMRDLDGVIADYLTRAEDRFPLVTLRARREFSGPRTWVNI